MTREEVYARLNGVFSDVFGRAVIISDATTASDVPGWDSLTHITLIGTVEDEFNVKFAMQDIVCMDSVGKLVEKILERIR